MSRCGSFFFAGRSIELKKKILTMKIGINRITEEHACVYDKSATISRAIRKEKKIFWASAKACLFFFLQFEYVNVITFIQIYL